MSALRLSLPCAIIGPMQRADEVFAWMALSRAPALDAAILSAAFERLGGIAGFVRILRRCTP